MQTCTRPHTRVHTPSRVLTQGNAMSLSHCCVNLCLSLLLLLHRSSLLLSCPPTVHPFIPDPVIFWSISKRWGEEGEEEGKICGLFFSLLFLPCSLCSSLSPLSLLPALLPFFSFFYSGFCHDKTLFEDSLYTYLTFDSAWLYMYSTCTHNYTHPGSVTSVDVGLWIGWKKKSFILSELFEEANQQSYVHWEIKTKAEKEKHTWGENSGKY